MATIILSAAGSALGGMAGGSFAGLTTLALGKAAGASLGSAIDQSIMGVGSDPVETGRVDRFRIMGSSEGATLLRVFGRARVSGQVIWSSRFLESANEQNVGGKGTGGQTVREFRYSVSLAIALCEGQIVRVGRIWADGQPLEQLGLTWRLHDGSETQLADPVIEAIEGSGKAPAYRGTAYVVFENLDLTPFGNRVPQFNFEVFRRTDPIAPDMPRAPAFDIQGVALVPGTGEYSLATEPVFLNRARGDTVALNVNNDLGIADLTASLDQMRVELPNARSIALVVSWFGDDLRCNHCTLRPGVEQAEQDGTPMPWRVGGQTRDNAKVVSRIEDRPVFGGTPTDASVLQAIAHINALGQSVMFYPFILMDILTNNGRVDPWSGGPHQPPVPWRGRVTTSLAPGVTGSPDKSAQAEIEVAQFFGTAKPSDFEVHGQDVLFTGQEEWSYRRFILHYAHLCAISGAVDAFCIGSELRGLTQIRDGVASYPFVRALCELALDVRAILGPRTRIGYAADWSEYFGHHPADGSSDVLYHLDPLWAQVEIDFIGIDNYMPLSDWRDGPTHADAAAGSIFELDYLKANVAGGEGFEWYYADETGRTAQNRLPIRDGAYGEDWVFRYKDLVNWWGQNHFNRLGGIKQDAATEWVPRSKPLWFTELGCPAVDKGTNQPNVFFDPKSSESFFPYFSTGLRDDFIQYRYLQAVFEHWKDSANNPNSDIYSGRMVDMSRAHVWAWDARPWPDFPNRLDYWVDGGNYDRGHWLNGRTSLCALAEVTAEVSNRAGLAAIDVAHLHGGLTGYTISEIETARQSLQPLMLAYGFESFMSDGKVAFADRSGRITLDITSDEMVVTKGEPVVAQVHGPAAEIAGRVTLGFVRSSADYQSGAAEAIVSDQAEPNAAQSSLPLVLSEGEAGAIAQRWLIEGRIAQDTISFALPLSRIAAAPGDIARITVDGRSDLYRIDRIDDAGHRVITAVRIEPGVYEVPIYREPIIKPKAIVAPTPVYAQILDLPSLSVDSTAPAPHLAVVKQPWAGAIAVYGASEDRDYVIIGQAKRPAVVGQTLDALPAAVAGVWMDATIGVRTSAGALQSRSQADVLNGANVAAIRYGEEAAWEIVQFQSAELIAPRVYRLRGFLRGQAGTDGIMPKIWPAGADFVLLDSAVVKLDTPAAWRGLERHYRVGPAKRAYNDPSYVHLIETFEGAALRPYQPAHLSAQRREGGAIEIRWIRRTRIDGDAWDGVEVPLGEERERYHLRIRSGSMILREFAVPEPQQIYSRTEQISDGAPARVTIEVAQVSDKFGPGPYKRIEFDE